METTLSPMKKMANSTPVPTKIGSKYFLVLVFLATVDLAEEDALEMEESVEEDDEEDGRISVTGLISPHWSTPVFLVCFFRMDETVADKRG